MSVSSIGSQASIVGLDNLSGTNSIQGMFHGHTISSGNTMAINNLSMTHDFPTTNLTSRNASIPH